jgi:hypothetical protein
MTGARSMVGDPRGRTRVGIIVATVALSLLISMSPQGALAASVTASDLVGLVNLSVQVPTGYLGVVDNVVVNASWSQLQTAPGSAITSNNTIDSAIANVRQLNASNPGLDLHLKLRINSGINAPSWAMSLGGPPVYIDDPTVTHMSGYIGRFWTKPFGTAYQDFMTKLAAKYDTVPEIRDVTISRCTIFFDEPFVRFTWDPQAIQALLAAGYSVRADHACQAQEIDDASAWTHTPSSLSVEDYQVVHAGGTTGYDLNFTQTMMTHCRTVLGRRCTLENNEMQAQPSARTSALYALMKAMGGAIAIQINTITKAGDLNTAIQNAVNLGAWSVELPQGYQAVDTPSQLQPYAQALQGNAGGRTSIAGGVVCTGSVVTGCTR